MLYILLCANYKSHTHIIFASWRSYYALSTLTPVAHSHFYSQAKNTIVILSYRESCESIAYMHCIVSGGFCRTNSIKTASSAFFSQSYFSLVLEEDLRDEFWHLHTTDEWKIHTTYSYVFWRLINLHRTSFMTRIIVEYKVNCLLTYSPCQQWLVALDCKSVIPKEETLIDFHNYSYPID